MNWKASGRKRSWPNLQYHFLHLYGGTGENSESPQ